MIETNPHHGLVGADGTTHTRSLIELPSTTDGPIMDNWQVISAEDLAGFPAIDLTDQSNHAIVREMYNEIIGDDVPQAALVAPQESSSSSSKPISDSGIEIIVGDGSRRITNADIMSTLLASAQTIPIPVPLTPREQELAELTLLPLNNNNNNNNRARKRKAVPKPVRPISYAEYYAQPANPESLQFHDPLPPIPVCSFLLDDLRGMSLEWKRECGRAMMTGQPMVMRSPDLIEAMQEPMIIVPMEEQPQQDTRFVPTTINFPVPETPEEGLVPIIVGGTVEETAQIQKPKPTRMTEIASYSTPTTTRDHMPIEEYSRNISNISLARQNDQSGVEAAAAGMIISGDGTIAMGVSTSSHHMPVHSYLAANMTMVEPSVEVS